MEKPAFSTVLFLCSGNFYRSRFAEAYFNYYARQQGLAWRAESRGFRLSGKNVGPISEHATAGLEQRGIALDDPARMPRVATREDLARCELIVALKEAEHRPLVHKHFPDCVERVEYWRIDDVDCALPESALADLERGLNGLLARLRPAGIGPMPGTNHSA